MIVSYQPWVRYSVVLGCVGEEIERMAHYARGISHYCTKHYVYTQSASL